ncbi:UNVERIFIED_CONTAM: hypothetical protein FKN15_040087 [Acipenser sinensis]
MMKGDYLLLSSPPPGGDYPLFPPSSPGDYPLLPPSLPGGNYLPLPPPPPEGEELQLFRPAPGDWLSNTAWGCRACRSGVKSSSSLCTAGKSGAGAVSYRTETLEFTS